MLKSLLEEFGGPAFVLNQGIALCVSLQANGNPQGLHLRQVFDPQVGDYTQEQGAINLSQRPPTQFVLHNQGILRTQTLQRPGFHLLVFLFVQGLAKSFLGWFVEIDWTGSSQPVPFRASPVGLDSRLGFFEVFQNLFGDLIRGKIIDKPGRIIRINQPGGAHEHPPVGAFIVCGACSLGHRDQQGKPIGRMPGLSDALQDIIDVFSDLA